MLSPISGVETGEYFSYETGQELFKEVLNGASTWYKPSPIKMEPFAPYEPNHLKLGFNVEGNEYLENPLTADAIPDLPYYSREFISPLNITDARIQKFLFHWKLRLYFKKIKKEYTKKSQVGDYSEEYTARIQEFNKELTQQIFEDKIKNINVIEQDEPLPNYIVHSKEEQAALYEYWKLVYSQRPSFVKTETSQPNYDFDFPVDTHNYDPWTEYRLIYKDIFTKGRQYWLLKAMPDWHFLQVGRPMSEPTERFSMYNPKRPNMRDSIFNMITLERWFDERREKANIYVRDSTSIRI